MNFGEGFALSLRGARICRPSWNGKGQWFAAVAGTSPAGGRTPPALPVYTGPDLGSCRPYLILHDATGKESPWFPNTIDLFATDYELARGSLGERVRAWGLDAIEIAKKENVPLLCLYEGEWVESTPDEFESCEQCDDRWVYLPVW